MIKKLKDYEKIVGRQVIKQIRAKAKKFSKKHIVSISSTHQGGGVAEILNSLVFLFDDVGVDFGWRILHGNPDFFTITKKFHNALQGGDINLTGKMKAVYEETNERFSKFTHLDHDLVVIHDPQPLALIDFYQKSQPWIFRAHVDLSYPNKAAWNYLKRFISQYDEMVVSAEEYKKNLSISQAVIHPAIDPLSPKNKNISSRQADKYLKNLGITSKKPIISQISRFDKWKDPEGVIEVFKKVRRKTDCQLVLLGNLASDDPEGLDIYKEIIKKHNHSKDIFILCNVADNDLAVNALQRQSAVVIQKSIREGFALTVSEALYKGTPVVASDIGGIPLQIINGENGFSHHPDDFDAFSDSIIRIIKDKKLRHRLGRNGHEHVKKNFLITRLMNDWLDLFGKYL